MEFTLQLPSVQIQLAQTFHYLGSQLPGLINRIQMFHRIKSYFLYEYSFTCPHSGQKHTYLGYYIELCNIEKQ